jgi:hypothetical protein
MCTVLGLAKGWWSVIGLLVEFTGFAFLLQITIHDVVLKYYDMVFGAKGLELGEMKAAADVEAGYRIWTALQRPVIKRLYAGGAVVLFSLLLQLVGSWPC